METKIEKLNEEIELLLQKAEIQAGELMNEPMRMMFKRILILVSSKKYKQGIQKAIDVFIDYSDGTKWTNKEVIEKLNQELK